MNDDWVPPRLRRFWHTNPNEDQVKEQRSQEWDKALDKREENLKRTWPEHPEIARNRRLANDISNTGPGAALPPVRPQQKSRDDDWEHER